MTLHACLLTSMALISITSPIFSTQTAQHKQIQRVRACHDRTDPDTRSPRYLTIKDTIVGARKEVQPSMHAEQSQPQREQKTMRASQALLQEFSEVYNHYDVLIAPYAEIIKILNTSSPEKAIATLQARVYCYQQAESEKFNRIFKDLDLQKLCQLLQKATITNLFESDAKQEAYVNYLTCRLLEQAKSVSSAEIAWLLYHKPLPILDKKNLYHLDHLLLQFSASLHAAIKLHTETLTLEQILLLAVIESPASARLIQSEELQLKNQLQGLPKELAEAAQKIRAEFLAKVQKRSDLLQQRAGSLEPLGNGSAMPMKDVTLPLVK